MSLLQILLLAKRGGGGKGGFDVGRCVRARVLRRSSTSTPNALNNNTTQRMNRDDLYHKELLVSQFPMSSAQSKTRNRLLAFSSAFASIYIGYYSFPIVSDGMINSAVYMVEHETNFMRKRGLWRSEWVLTTFPDITYGTAKKCVEKGMLEVVLNLCELKEKETDEDVKEGAKRVLVMLVQSESGRKRVDGDGKLRKRVKRAAPEALLAPPPPR